MIVPFSKPPEPPCLGCEHRCVGCHDPERCAGWAQHMRDQDAYHAAKRKAVESVSVVMEYRSIRKRRIERRMKNMKKRGNADAE